MRCRQQSPVSFNTGLSIKNLEALGYAKPLVTATVGSEGIEDGIDTAFLVADTASEYVAKLVEILNNNDFAERLSAQAFAYAEHWNERTVAQLAKILD